MSQERVVLVASSDVGTDEEEKSPMMSALSTWDPQIPAKLSSLHPIGWVAAIYLSSAIYLTIIGDALLLGHLPWWGWAIMIGTVVVSTQFTLLDQIRKGIEKVSDAFGSLAWKLGWVVFVLQLFNVITRYSNGWFERDILFGQTSSMAWMSFALLFLVGVAQGVKNGVNPRIDFWWGEFSDKLKAWIDFLGHSFLFMPFIVMGSRLLLRYSYITLGRKRDGSWPEGWQVWKTWEKAADADQLPVGPIQAFVFVAFILWGAQMIAEIIKTGFVLLGEDELGGIDNGDAPMRVE